MMSSQLLKSGSLFRHWSVFHFDNKADHGHTQLEVNLLFLFSVYRPCRSFVLHT